MRLDPIDRLEAARYMGIKGAPDPQISAILEQCENLLINSVNPKYVYRSAAVSLSENGVQLDGLDVPLTGEDIRRHLEGCSTAVVLGATLTAEADKLIRRLSSVSASEGLAMDCLCSAAIEQVCNRAEEEIFADNNSFRTWRFSPGYGDLPIDLQPDILNFLNAQRRIGLTVNGSGMLVPSKSVTAIIGVSETSRERGKRGCEICSMRGRCGLSRLGGCGKNK